MTIDLMLDRDGTLIFDSGYLSSKNAVREIIGVSEFLKRFASQDCRLHVISNQSGIARGLISMEQFQEVNYAFEEAYRAKQIIFDSINYCLHSENDNCICRKPKIGMLLGLRNKFNVDPKRTIVIGDKKTDVAMAKAFGCVGIQVSCNLFELTRWEMIEQKIEKLRALKQ